MSIPLEDVARFLDRRLDVARYDEPESNELIVRAKDSVSRVAAAVSTTFHAIEEAKRLGADLLVVHHRSWPEIDLGLVEEKHRRLAEHGISLYGAHSALDGAPGISNGDLLARAVGLTVEQRFLEYHGGLAGVIANGSGTFDAFVARLRTALGARVEGFRNNDRFGRVAIATGGAPFTTMVEAAAALGADTYLTGEGSMYTRLYGKERGVNIVFGTHWATEQFGVKGLAEAIEGEFGLPWDFIAEPEDVR